MLKTIYVDDEPHMISRFQMECEHLPEIELAGIFENAVDALSFAKTNPIDAAFLDVSMPGMSGLELSEHLKDIYPEIVIIFISAHEEYVNEAILKRGADYYLLKPYKSADIESAVQRAALLTQRKRKRVFIETFGRFAVYIDGKALSFTSKRAKEVLGVLVDRKGTTLDTKSIWNILYENEEYDHYKASSLRRTLARLRYTLENAEIAEILESNKGEYRVNPDKFTCDYYDFLEGDTKAINSFFGEYMTEYTWAEETIGTLIEMCPDNHVLKKQDVGAMGA